MFPTSGDPAAATGDGDVEFDLLENQIAALPSISETVQVNYYDAAVRNLRSSYLRFETNFGVELRDTLDLQKLIMKLTFQYAIDYGKAFSSFVT